MAWMMVLLLEGCSLALTGQRMMTHQVERVGFEERTLGQTEDSQYKFWYSYQGAEDRRPVVVLLHGFGGDGLSTWNPVMRNLARDYRVLVPDLLWFGESHGFGAPSLEAQVQAVAGMLDAVDVEKATVVGLSYGGFVALAMAKAMPERLERLGIMDSPGPFFDEAQEQAMLQHFGATRVEDVFLPKDGRDVQRLLGLAWYKPPQLPGFLLEDVYRHQFGRWQNEQGALLADLRGRRGQTTLPDLQIPVLVIWGRYDSVFPLAIGEKLAAELHGSLAVIEDAAHGPNIEKPRDVAAALQNWLQVPLSASPAPKE